MDHFVDDKVEIVEDPGGTPDAGLVEADLPPGHDTEDPVEPAATEEIYRVVYNCVEYGHKHPQTPLDLHIGRLPPSGKKRLYSDHDEDIGMDAVVQPPGHDLVVHLGEDQLAVDEVHAPEHSGDETRKREDQPIEYDVTEVFDPPAQLAVVLV